MNDTSDALARQSPLSETALSISHGRREALTKLGVYSACTAPLVLGMPMSAQAHVAFE